MCYEGLLWVYRFCPGVFWFRVPVTRRCPCLVSICAGRWTNGSPRSRRGRPSTEPSNWSRSSQNTSPVGCLARKQMRKRWGHVTTRDPQCDESVGFFGGGLSVHKLEGMTRTRRLPVYIFISTYRHLLMLHRCFGVLVQHNLQDNWGTDSHFKQNTSALFTVCKQTMQFPPMCFCRPLVATCIKA